MIRKQLRQIPLETGNRVAVYFLIAWSAFVGGWVAHAMTKPLLCWWAA